MISGTSRFIVLFAMLVCLPLNGLAAVAMPACAAHGQAMMLHADSVQMDVMPGCNHHHEPRSSPGKTPCDHCFSCHMASAQAIFPLAFAVHALAADQSFSAVMAATPQSPSSSLFRPPILTFA